METIELNGKRYVTEIDMNVEIERIKKELGDKSSLKFFEGCLQSDEANCLGIGSAELKGEWFKCSLSTEYLEKVIKCLKEMSIDKKKGLESIQLVWSHDKPAFIGQVRNNVVSGFVIAPRIDK